MSTLLEFSISPMDKGQSLSLHVARSLNLIDRSGIDYRLNPMGTVLEGDWDEVFAVVKKCFEAMAVDCDRIAVSIKVDWRKGAKGRLHDKTASIERRLGRGMKQ